MVLTIASPFVCYQKNSQFANILKNQLRNKWEVENMNK
jgi:hypothetical protein